MRKRMRFVTGVGAAIAAGLAWLLGRDDDERYWSEQMHS